MEHLDTVASSGDTDCSCRFALYSGGYNSEWMQAVVSVRYKHTAVLAEAYSKTCEVTDETEHCHHIIDHPVARSSFERSM